MLAYHKSSSPFHQLKVDDETISYCDSIIVIKFFIKFTFIIPQDNSLVQILVFKHKSVNFCFLQMMHSFFARIGRNNYLTQVRFQLGLKLFLVCRLTQIRVLSFYWAVQQSQVRCWWRNWGAIQGLCKQTIWASLWGAKCNLKTVRDIVEERCSKRGPLEALVHVQGWQINT